MSKTMNTILAIGGTSGIGHSFATRWHSQGKKVIVTCRRQDRLTELKSFLPGLEIYTMDNTDLAKLPTSIDELFDQYPFIDTVWVNSGLQNYSTIKDKSTSSDESIINEITLNLTSPLIIARHVIPLLLAKKTPTTFMITSSGLGFVPIGMFSVYNATKAAIHLYLVSIRQTLQDSKVRVLELVPPAVRTELGDQEVLSKFPAMELDEFTDEAFAILDKHDGEDLKEIAAGSAVPRVEAWRGSIGKILVERGLGG